MVLYTANGTKEYKVAELDFTNIMCDLEDYDVDVMGMLDADQNKSNTKMFSAIRAIVAVLTGTKDLATAGKMLSEHIKYGGTLDEVMNCFAEAMETAGFGKAAEEIAKEKKQTKAE